MPTHKAYEKNKERIKAYNAYYKARHPDWYKAYQKRYREKNSKKIKKWYQEYYLRTVEQHRESSRRNNAKDRLSVLSHYGLSCACCGESQYAFLQIDHINGGGVKHKKIAKGKVYKWIIRNKFPDGFQTLCANCNFAKGASGQCPHQQTAKENL